MLHLLRHQGPLGTVCLLQDSNHVWLWPGYYLHHDIAKHGFSGVAKESTREWNGALLSSVMWVGSVCRWLMDIHVYDIDLVSIIFQNVFAHDTCPTSGFMVWGAITYNSQSHLLFLQGRINSARYIAQVVSCYCHFFNRKMMCFFSRTKHVHIRLLGCNVLFVCTWWSGNLLFLQSLPNIEDGCKMLGTFYLRMTFGTFLTACMREYTHTLPPGGALCINMTVWEHFTVTCLFHLVWICYHILLQW